MTEGSCTIPSDTSDFSCLFYLTQVAGCRNIHMTLKRLPNVGASPARGSTMPCTPGGPDKQVSFELQQ